ncbi:hypothetical protein [Actinokineospora sp. HUAS TT18]|uniref:hypothetical protein n=1 Tax=Actinokineospora sp. HUAS TT18 TaxID=3447451 RepID=UPI003F51C15E
MKRWSCLVLAAALVACQPTAEPAAPPPTEPTISDAPSKPLPRRFLPGAVKPGTKAKPGEPLTIEAQTTGENGLVSITVTAIEEKKYSLIKTYERTEGLIPYFVRLTVRNESDRDMSDFLPINIRFGLQDKLTPAWDTFNPPLRQCANHTKPATNSLPTKGAAYDLCFVVLSKAGNPVVDVQYNGPYYNENPLIWAP